jgi:hypothetical protein
MKLKQLLVSLTFALISKFAFAVDPSISAYVDHSAYVSSKVFEFDIMIKATGSTSTFELRTFQAGLYVNPAWVNGGTLSIQNVSTYTEMSGSGYNGAFQWNATDKLINCSVNFDVLGPVSCIATSVSTTPVNVTRIRVTNTTDFSCSNPNIKFNYTPNISPLRLRTTFSWREVACTTNYDMFYPGRTYTGSATFNNEVYSTDVDGKSDVSSNNPGFCFGQLTLKAIIQGFYVGGGQMSPGLMNAEVLHSNAEQSDTITVELRTVADPSVLATSPISAILSTTGIAYCFFDLSLINDSYWIVLKHRNLIETWSSNPVFLTAYSNYDFTIASTQAFDEGALPMFEVEPGIWACYNGDIDHDGAITSLDMTIEENDTNIGAFGYVTSDLDGDGGSTSLDMTLIENNAFLGIFVADPIP